VLVAEKGNAEYSILRLIRIGYTNIEGYLTGGIEQFLKNGGKTKKVRIVKPKDFLEKSNNPCINFK
jgi:hypothetical protein